MRRSNSEQAESSRQKAGESWINCWNNAKFQIANSKQIIMTEILGFKFQCSGPSAFAFTP